MALFVWRHAGANCFDRRRRGRPSLGRAQFTETDHVNRTHTNHPLVIFLAGGFSGRIGGYGYGFGHGGVGVIGGIVIIVIVLMVLGRI